MGEITCKEPLYSLNFWQKKATEAQEAQRKSEAALRVAREALSSLVKWLGPPPTDKHSRKTARQALTKINSILSGDED